MLSRMQEQVMRQLLFGVDVPGRLARMESVERVPMGHHNLHLWLEQDEALEGSSPP